LRVHGQILRACLNYSPDPAIASDEKNRVKKALDQRQGVVFSAGSAKLRGQSFLSNWPEYKNE